MVAVACSQRLLASFISARKRRFSAPWRCAASSRRRASVRSRVSRRHVATPIIAAPVQNPPASAAVAKFRVHVSSIQVRSWRLATLFRSLFTSRIASRDSVRILRASLSAIVAATAARFAADRASASARVRFSESRTSVSIRSIISAHAGVTRPVPAVSARAASRLNASLCALRSLSSSCCAAAVARRLRTSCSASSSFRISASSSRSRAFRSAVSAPWRSACSRSALRTPSV